MLLIYTHKITNRVSYIFELMIGDLLGLEYKLTSKKNQFNSFEGPKFSYTQNPLGDELFIEASTILFERGIEGHTLSSAEYEGNIVFFMALSKASALPFDPFAASFYFVSRYEEYLPYVKDKYSRFEASKSLAYEKGFLQKPVVNIWTNIVGSLLKKNFTRFRIPKKEFTFVPTIDLDAAWTFQAKGLVRSAGGYLKSIAQLNLKDIGLRTRVLAGMAKDPYDTYDLQLSLQAKYELKAIYFILFADYAHNDKNIHINSRKYHVLIKSLADYSEVGIHSSYGSSFEHGKLKIELDRLSGVLNHEITKCRQHYLRLNMPLTYRNFLDNGILEDYSMGFTAQQGFRAGISDSFYFYDLDLDTPTKLRVHPFAFSETLGTQGKPKARMEKILQIISEVKAVNGTLIGAWDNASLSSYHGRGNWRMNYEKIIKFALE